LEPHWSQSDWQYAAKIPPSSNWQVSYYNCRRTGYLISSTALAGFAGLKLLYPPNVPVISADHMAING